MTLKELSQFGKKFQLKVFGALLTDRKFVLNVRDIIEEEFFDLESHKWILSKILSYFDKYNTTITLDILKVEVQKVDNEVLRTSIKEELKHSYVSTEEDLQYVKEEFTNFCKNQKLKQALLDGADLLDSGEYEAIRKKVEDALKAGMDKDIGHEYNKDVETRYRDDYRPTIPSPWPEVNELIQGGFGPGDLVLVFGNPGGGKSWLMVAIAGYAALQGYNVNYYTLELGEDYVGKRFDAFFTKIGIDQIKERRSEVETVIENLPGNIIIKEYAPKSATINTVDAHIQRCADNEHKPGLVVVDYLDYLRASDTRGVDRKEQIDNVYIGAKGLAKKHKIPVLSPSQVNRMGAKDDIIEGDKAAGSYDKMMVADMAFSLSRKKEDKVLGTGRLHVMKSRYGDDGMTFNLLMDTNIGEVKVKDRMDLTEEDINRKSYDDVAKKFFKLQDDRQDFELDPTDSEEG